MNMAQKAAANRTSGILTVTCPSCKHENEFPDWSEMYIFICEHCGEPVEVAAPTN
jgi:ribosomal protein S27E